MKEGRKPEHPKKTPGDELEKMPLTKVKKCKPQARLKPAIWHWRQAVDRKAEELTITPRVADKLIIMIIIIMIIIAFKGAIRDFLQSPHSAANCLQHVHSSGPGAIVCKSRATHRGLITCKCHVTCLLVRRDTSAITFDRVEIAFIRALSIG